MCNKHALRQLLDGFMNDKTSILTSCSDDDIMAPCLHRLAAFFPMDIPPHRFVLHMAAARQIGDKLVDWHAGV